MDYSGLVIIGIIALGILTVMVIATVTVCLYLFDFGVKRKPDQFTDIDAIMKKSDPPHIAERKEFAFSNAYDYAEITSHDGLKLRARILRAKRRDGEKKRAVICVHGYRSNSMREFSPFIRYYHQNGFDVILPDNRAHGESEGKFISYGIFDRFDVKRWCEYAVKLFGEDEALYLHGVSMGGSTVLMAAALKLPESVRGIIADCAFISPYEQFRHVLKEVYHIPAAPLLEITGLICRVRAGWGFRSATTLDAVARTTLPILFIHGDIDSFIPPESSKRNYEACNSEKELLIVKNAAHALSYYVGTEEYEKKLSEFFDKH